MKNLKHDTKALHRVLFIKKFKSNMILSYGSYPKGKTAKFLWNLIVDLKQICII